MPKRENSHWDEKVHLRELAIQMTGKARPAVLDLFAARGRLWGSLQHGEYLGMEKDKAKARTGVLVGDNMKFLPTLDLSGFDIIDCDAFGIPDKQIDAISKNGTLRDGTVLVYTCIRQGNTPVPRELARHSGVGGIARKAPAMLGRYAGEIFDNMLSELSPKRVEYVITDGSVTKRYGFIVVNRNK